MKEWLDESYRAQAPKKLIAQLDASGSPAPTVTTTKSPEKKATKKPAKKKR